MTGRDLIRYILNGNLLDKNVVIYHVEKGRQRILSVDATGNTECDEIEIVTDGEVAE